MLFIRKARSMRRVFVNSNGQSGTHLASKCLSLLGGEFTAALNTSEDNGQFTPIIASHNGMYDPSIHVLTGPNWPSITEVNPIKERFDQLARGQFGAGHILYTPAGAKMFQELDICMIVITREPRDWSYSSARKMMENPTAFGRTSDTSVEQHIKDSVFGFPPQRTVGRLPMVTRYGFMSGWAGEPLVLVIRFEDLVGARGGGISKAQTSTIKAIAKHVGVRLTRSKLHYVQENLFGGSETFRKGLIGTWREHEMIYAEPDIEHACREAGAMFGYYKGAEHLSVFSRIYGILRRNFP